MKSKSLISTGIFLLSVLVLMSFVSSASFTVSPTTFEFDNSNAQSLTLSLNNLSESKSFGVNSINLTGESGYTAYFSLTGDLTDVNLTSLTLTPTSSIDFSKFNFGKDYTNTFKIYNSADPSDYQTLTVKISEDDFCEGVSSAGGLDLTIDDVNNKGKFGDENNWYPLDTIEVDVVVENTGSDSIKNLKLKWALYSEAGKEVMHGTESSFKLNDDSDKTVTFNFTLDNNVDELNSETYTLYVSATGKVSDDENTPTCVDDSTTAEMNIDDDLVVLESFEIPETVSCGSELHIIGTAWNIGSNDEDNVYVVAKSSELGINKRFEVGDISSLEGEDFDFAFSIPQNTTAKVYGFELTVYNDDDDVFQSDDDEDSRITLVFPVTGTCLGGLTASLTGEVQSGGEAGKDLVVNVTVKNTGKSSSTFTLNTNGYSTWADSVQVDQPLFTLGAGESNTVLLTFKVKEGISGDNSFSADVYSNSNLVTSQSFAVTIEKPSSWFDFDSWNLSEKFGGKWYLWVIGAINVLLIVIIIVVAVKVARK